MYSAQAKKQALGSELLLQKDSINLWDKARAIIDLKSLELILIGKGDSDPQPC